MAFFNGKTFEQDDDAQKKMREHLGRGMQQKIDEDLVNSLMGILSPNNTATSISVHDDDKDVLTYEKLKEAQEKLKSPYDTYGTGEYKRVHLNPKEYPVLAPFMKMPSISKHINVVLDAPSVYDPYAMEIKIEYKLPEDELVEYRKGLYDFIMNFISDKSLNDKEIDVFEKMSNDLAPQPTTLEDIQDILDKI